MVEGLKQACHLQTVGIHLQLLSRDEFQFLLNLWFLDTSLYVAYELRRDSHESCNQIVSWCGDPFKKW